jgi:hypothetical protein
LNKISYNYPIKRLRDFMLLTKNYKDSTTLEITDITIVSTQIVRGSYVAIAVVLISIIIYPYTRAPVISNFSYFKILKAVGDTSTTTMFDVLVPYKMLYFESAGRMQRKSK